MQIYIHILHMIVSTNATKNTFNNAFNLLEFVKSEVSDVL